jgi:hypothetical protein
MSQLERVPKNDTGSNEYKNEKYIQKLLRHILYYDNSIIGIIITSYKVQDKSGLKSMA